MQYNPVQYEEFYNKCTEYLTNFEKIKEKGIPVTPEIEIEEEIEEDPFVEEEIPSAAFYLDEEDDEQEPEELIESIESEDEKSIAQTIINLCQSINSTEELLEKLIETLTQEGPYS